MALSGRGERVDCRPRHQRTTRLGRCPRTNSSPRRDRFPPTLVGGQCGVITRSPIRFPPVGRRSASANAVKRWASEIRSTSMAIASTACTTCATSSLSASGTALSHLRAQRTFPRADPQDGEQHRRGEQGGRRDEQEVRAGRSSVNMGNRPCPWWRVERCASEHTTEARPPQVATGDSQPDRVGGTHTHTRRRWPSRSRLSAHGMIVRRRRAPVLHRARPGRRAAKAHTRR